MGAVLPIPRLSLAEWDAQALDEVDRHAELADGVIEVSPPESYANREVGQALIMLIRAALPRPWGAAADQAITLVGDPVPTVRIPDVAVLHRDRIDREAGRHDPTAVALVAEVVSTSSRGVDWGRKRAEYAAADIPAYLVIDRQRRRLALYTDPEGGDYRTVTGAYGTAMWAWEGHEVVFDLDQLTEPD